VVVVDIAVVAANALVVVEERSEKKRRAKQRNTELCGIHFLSKSKAVTWQPIGYLFNGSRQPAPSYCTCRYIYYCGQGK
jgi:limonene-1,2-epoxide hydrolase